MSRNPGYSQAGANGGYANGPAAYNGGGYNGYGASDASYNSRPSGERPRRPGGYGAMNAPADGYAPRPSVDRDRPRRPGGYGGLAQDDEVERRPSSDRDRDRDRRPGGYGAAPFSGRDESPRMAPRPSSNDRSPAKGRSADRQNGSRPRNANYGPGSQAVEEVLQFIRQNWDFMTKDQCVPIEVALKLMDSSSLGLASQADQFQQTHQQLQNALKGIVNGTPASHAPTSLG
jgi:exocyst complex component 4